MCVYTSAYGVLVVYVVGTAVVSVQVDSEELVYGIVEVSVQVEREEVMIVQGKVVQEIESVGMV